MRGDLSTPFAGIAQLSEFNNAEMTPSSRSCHSRAAAVHRGEFFSLSECLGIRFILGQDSLPSLFALEKMHVNRLDSHKGLNLAWSF